MQTKNVTSKTEKLRAFALGVAEVIGDTGRFCWKTARATLVIFAGIILAGLMMADPETATFRDLLLALRMPAIWTSSAILAFMYAGVCWILNPPQPKRA
ncbi:hypothetical protein G0R39_004479 [Salmonella enterica]|nr:hypothetical protein [Salmonella enterica]